MDKYTSARNTKSNIVINEESDEEPIVKEKKRKTKKTRKARMKSYPMYHSKNIKKGAREKPVIKEPIESPISVSFRTKAMRRKVETYAWKNIDEVFAKKNKTKVIQPSKAKIQRPSSVK